MENTRAHLVDRIDRYLNATGMAAWALGVLACRSEQVIPKARKGSLTLRTIERLEAFMVENPAGLAAPNRNAKFELHTYRVLTH